MDSMRSLNHSLPQSANSPTRRRQENSTNNSTRPTPSDLHQAFRTAALSVTQLYKSATIEVSESRAAGYQDALDGLLLFLDHENLGLCDGEGWRVRQWATERLLPVLRDDGSDDESEEPMGRGAAPMEKTGEDVVATGVQASSPATSSISLPVSTEQLSQLQQHQQQQRQSPSPQQLLPPIPRPEMFQFQSHAPVTSLSETTMDTTLDLPPLRSTRFSHRHSYSAHIPRERKLPGLGPNQSLGTGPGTGTGTGNKRKAAALSEFFDVGALANWKDGYGYGGGGGGKRGRMV